MNLVSQIRLALSEAMHGPDDNRNRSWTGAGFKDKGSKEMSGRSKSNSKDGVKEFTVYPAWRAACRLAPGFSKFDGDDSGCIAEFTKTGNYQSAGSWDGERGTLASSGVKGAHSVWSKNFTAKNRLDRLRKGQTD